MASIIKGSVTVGGTKIAQITSITFEGRQGSDRENYHVKIVVKDLIEYDNGTVRSVSRSEDPNSVRVYEMDVTDLVIDEQGAPIMQNVELMNNFIGSIYFKLMAMGESGTFTAD